MCLVLSGCATSQGTAPQTLAEALPVSGYEAPLGDEHRSTPASAQPQSPFPIQRAPAAEPIPSITLSAETTSVEISLELHDTSLKDALMLVSQSAGLNFIIDQDVPEDTRVTVFVSQAKVGDVLEFILQTNALEKKVLNPQTVLIYPASDEKKARYADVYTRSYPIAHADPERMAELLRTLVKPAELFVDARSRSVIIRDVPAVLETADRLISLHDRPPSEVLLDVEIMEVSSDVLTNLGVEYPSSLSLSVQGAAGVAGSLRWSELGDLNGDSYTLGVGDPLAVLNLRNTLGSGNILAKPQIRVKNLEQASILIGDKVPVITSTLNQTSGFESQSVTYLDVGVKLEVEPEIFPDNEVSIKVMLEVSNIAREIVGDNGLRAYQIGTRTANTTLQLADGETQILAGLIKTEEILSESRVPGLGAIPGLGRLFSNENNNTKKSELVLFITPRIVRNVAPITPLEGTFYSGTRNRLSLVAPDLGQSATYSTTRASQRVIPSDVSLTASTNSTSRDTGPVSTPIVGSPSAAPRAPLNLLAPRAIAGGQPFNASIALTANRPALKSIELSFDPSKLTSNGVQPLNGMASVQSYSDDGKLRFDLSDGLSTSGLLATLAFSPVNPAGEVRTTLTLKGTARDGTMLAAEEHELLISPSNNVESQLGLSAPAETSTNEE